MVRVLCSTWHTETPQNISPDTLPIATRDIENVKKDLTIYKYKWNPFKNENDIIQIYSKKWAKDKSKKSSWPK